MLLNIQDDLYCGSEELTYGLLGCTGVFIPRAMDISPRAVLWDVKREALVPVSIDIDVDGVRFIDSFTWDLHHQSQMSPENFSRRMVEELGLSRSFIIPVAQSIIRQLFDFRRAMPAWASEGTISAGAEENLQLIEIDIRFRSIIYRDRLQWDVNCLYNSPENFARCTVADLGLPQEMEAPIAYSVHQQLCKHRMADSGFSTEDAAQLSNDRLGPQLSLVHPVDQYEFNSRDWSDHRPTSKSSY